MKFGLPISRSFKRKSTLDRPITLISANSVMNSILLPAKTKFKDKSDFIYEELSKSGHEVRNQVTAVALKQGMISLPDTSGTNIDVQILIQPKLIGQNHLS
jgi:hypothetical protein